MKQIEKNKKIEKYQNCLKCKEMFLNRWKAMENQIVLVDENGDTRFMQSDIFDKFFITPELLVGYYIWRCNDVEDGYSLFIEEYNGWVEDCKAIVKTAKNIFEKEIFNIIEYKVYLPLKNCLDAILFDSSTNIAHMKCEIENYIIDIDLNVCGEVNVEYKGIDYKSPNAFPKELKKIIKNHYSGKQNMAGLCYIKDNNWYEFFYNVKDKKNPMHYYSGRDLFDGNLYEYNQEELKEEFLNACLNAIGYYMYN